MFKRGGREDHVSAPFDPSFRFSTSWILPPSVLFALRAVISIYIFTTIFFVLGWYSTRNDSVDARRTFSYFTKLTWWGLGFYFAFSAAHTASYWWRGVPFLARWPKVLQTLHSIFYSTIVVFPFLVTIVFWAILFNGSFVTRFSAWDNVSEHAFNSVFALLEIVLPRTAPLPWLNIIPLIIVLALYLGLAYLTYGTQGFYTYNFLDYHNGGRGRVAGYCIGILVATIIVFVIVHFLIKLRVWATETKMSMTGKLSSRDVRYRGAPHTAKDVELADMPGPYSKFPHRAADGM